MKETTINLLSLDQQIYLEKILRNRELFKSRGKKFVSVEKSTMGDYYAVYLLEHLERSIFDGELVEYIEL
jgi:hypothetical protein